jgi:glycosyltransferase involved in cell wall biosynthesis
MRIAMLLHKPVEFDSRVRREASALAGAGHEVVVLELAEVPSADVTLDGFARRSCLPPASIRHRLPSQIYRPLMLLYLVRGIMRERPEVVHAHDAAMLVPGILGARLTGARLVYDSHELATSVPYRERTWEWFVGAVERIVVPHCAAVITVSDGIAAALRNRYGLRDRPTVIRNVSALERSGKGGLRAALEISPAVPLVLHQGAPAPDRGCDVLVEAIGALPDARLVFLGDPEPGYDKRLRETIAAQGLHDRVSLIPGVPLDQLLANTAEADVGVTLLQDTCENHRLALPNKLFEYIAAGVPVVASALPETEALVNAYGVGWCVAPSDPMAVAGALSTALAARDDPALGSRLARAASELRWAREQERLLDLYAGLRRDEARSSSPLALLLVRNSVTHDGRVLRAARTAALAINGESLVLGVANENTSAGDAFVDGVRVRRLRPVGRLPSIFGAGGTRTHSSTAAATNPPAAVAAPDASPIATLTPRTRARRIAVGAWFALRAVAIARRVAPVLVHASDWNTMWAGIAIKLMCRSRLIYDSHELWAERNGRWESAVWLRLSEALFVRIADEVITTSPGHAQALAARYHISMPCVVRNVPDWATQAENPPLVPPQIVYIGGLMPGRGLEQMIDALPRLSEVGLRAIGPGAAHYRVRLRSRADANGVGDRVELLDPVSPGDVQAALCRASIGLCLIQPICRSYELSLPNKLLEYAAAGVPVLASDLPVIAGIVNEYGLGVVVPPSDPGAIADGICRLLDPAQRAAAVAGAHRFASENTWANESELLVRAYTGAPAG